MKSFPLFSLTIAVAFGAGQVAHAQRDAPDRAARREARQGQMQNMTPEQRQQYFQQRWQDRYNAATPEQKARMDQMRQQMNQRLQDAGIDPNAPDAFTKAQAAGVDLGFGGQGGQGGGRGGRNGGGFQPDPAKDAQRRAIMIAAGITEKPTQDAILNFMNEQERSRTGLLRLARAAARALVTPQARTVANGAPVETPIDPETQLNRISETYETYNQAVQEDRVRYGQALQQLNDQINFMSNPRLHSFMVLAGILEYDTLSLGGVPAIFPQEVVGNGNANPAGGGTVIQTAATAATTAEAPADDAPQVNAFGVPTGAAPAAPAATAPAPAAAN